MRMKRSYGVHKYADGGKVELNKKAKKGAKKPKAKPEMLGTGAAAKAGEAILNTREQQMKDLGLKDGGKVKMKPHVPPRRKSPILEKVKGPPGGNQTPGAKGTYPPKKRKG